VRQEAKLVANFKRKHIASDTLVFKE